MLANWNNIPLLHMSFHSYTSSKFVANQSLLLLLNAAYLEEKQQIPIFIIFGLIQPRLKPMIYHTRGEQANHYISDAGDM